LSKVKVACAQIDVAYGDKNRTVSNACDWIEEAAHEGADVVLFPELVLSAGYYLGERYHSVAETVPGTTTKYIAKKASDCGVYLIAGMAEKSNEGTLFDSAVAIDRQGELVGTYRKTHIYTPTESIFTPGSELPVFQTDFGKIGILICYDLEFPEPARVLALKGAEIIFHLVADWPRGVPGEFPERIFDVSFRARALENRITIASCNRVGEDPDLHSAFYGLSRIVGTQGEILAGADRGEKLITACIDLEQARKERQSYDYLLNRRPDLYDQLSAK
jgi:predicted amidohydrolase